MREARYHAKTHGDDARSVEHAAALRAALRPPPLSAYRGPTLSNVLRLARPARGERRGPCRPRGMVARLLRRRCRHAQGHAAAGYRTPQPPPAPAQETPRDADACLGVTRAYVGIGSNLDDPRQQVLRAFDELTRLPETTLTARSSLYRTAPVGHAAQPHFINAVAALDTTLPAAALLIALQEIEARHGRKRTFPSAPRTVYLDR